VFPIVESRALAPEVRLFRVVAPRIARKREPGQFVIVRLHVDGERIPLTIADACVEEGTVTLIVQGIGKTTKLMNSLRAGDASGVGAAIAYPTAVAFKRAGNEVLTILGGRTRELVILEAELAAVSDELVVTTDDGSLGRQGLVTEPLTDWLTSGRRIDRVLAIGPVPMMHAVAETTRLYGIPTIVSLNSIMIDGTGMCGGCRVLVGGESKFACVDGPEFDAHQVDFDVLTQRNAMYRDSERRSLEAFLADPDGEVEKVRHDCGVSSAEEERESLEVAR